MDYEASRGVADVLEREAGHDGQGLASLRLQHADLAGLDDPEGFDSVMKVAGVRREIDLIVRLKVF